MTVHGTVLTLRAGAYAAEVAQVGSAADALAAAHARAHVDTTTRSHMEPAPAADRFPRRR